MDYGEYFSEAAPPLSIDAREAAWLALGVQVPEPLVMLYASVNGGLTRASVLPLPGGNDTVVNTVFALGGNAPYPLLADETAELAEVGMLPEAALAFADDPGGNIFAIALDPEDFGRVFFIDHEVWVEDPAETLRESANATLVAKDLLSFFESLREALH
ncbi:SMI1/KNR4 family protein [Vannielia litorea]|uniref:SMI1-KNR4 cell-wall n=1 Tax=Vannielia litorea TaxID=1217970 RepID=A0A1N6ID71_9RHOB|nr:SMI1/KNR4 family protein [Vannielia litorea]SIO29885.1 SMI1-KNR4 cell-wall [Vannielia litorea]